MTQDDNDATSQDQAVGSASDPQVADPSAPIGSLMGGGRLPRRDLDGEALAAARQAIAGAEDSLVEARHELRAAARRAGPREWLLRSLLALNLVLMAAMLFVPSTARPAAGPAPEPAGVQPDQPQLPAPTGTTPRPAVTPIPDRELYNAALVQAEQGQFDAAVTTLERYVAENPKLGPAVRQNVYLAISYYLARAGRLEESDRYGRMVAQLHARSSLPDDLLGSAGRAEQEGRAGEMRQAYARFLLLQRTIRPDLRRHVAEAYLKLGDSYRLEAEQAEERADAERRAQERELRRTPKEAKGK